MLIDEVFIEYINTKYVMFYLFMNVTRGNYYLSWIFKSMSAITATASAANKTWILKRKMAVVSLKH